MTIKIMINNKERDGLFLLRQHVDRGVHCRRALCAHVSMTGSQIVRHILDWIPIPILVTEKYDLPSTEALFVLPEVLGIRDVTYWPARLLVWSTWAIWRYVASKLCRIPQWWRTIIWSHSYKNSQNKTGYNI